jgi:hypothetical protein
MLMIANLPVRLTLSRMALAVFTLVALPCCGLGWGTDRDSLRVVRAAQGILQGHYERSRSFGFPLHEAASALAYAAGGLTGANLASALVTMLGILLALRLVGVVAPGRVGVASVALCGSPLLLTNASAAIDFGWSFAAAMGVLLATRRSAWAWLFVSVAALLLIRPDNVLFAAAVCLSLFGAGRRRGLRACVACAGACLVAMSVYLTLNKTQVFLTGVSTSRPWDARLARACVLAAASLGPGGVLAAALVVRCRPGDADAGLLARTALWSWALYVPRFVALPDQVEYLILPVETTILAACVVASSRLVWGMAALVCLPDVVTLSLFQRHEETGALSVRPALQWGAVPQDWAARRFAMRMQTAPALAGATGALPGTWRYDTYLPAYVSDKWDLAIGAGALYRVARPGYRWVYACNVPLGPGIGWRGLEAPVADHGGPVRCWLATPATTPCPAPGCAHVATAHLPGAP